MSFEDLSNAAAAEKKTIPTESPIEKRITERLEKGASAERQIELNQELARVLDFFNVADIQPYIAGGAGVDLIDGT